jgi:hypothetical protein
MSIARARGLTGHEERHRVTRLGQQALMETSMTIMSLGEAIAAGAREQGEQLKRARWGKWRFNREAMTLTHDEHDYEVDLERMQASAAVLDWIFQVSAKNWATSEDIGDLVRALDLLVDPQATLCSRGLDTATPLTRERIEKRLAALESRADAVNQ